MSTRRFVAYFLAISAGSTVVFASKLIGNPKPPAVTTEQAADLFYLESPSPLIQELHKRRRYKVPVVPGTKVAQVAFSK